MNDLQILRRDTLNFWRDYIVKAEVTIDGVPKDMPIIKKMINYEKGTIRFNIHVTAGEGEVQRVVLFNKNNEAVRVRDSSLQKGPDGLLTVFQWTLLFQEDFLLGGMTND